MSTDNRTTLSGRAAKVTAVGALVLALAWSASALLMANRGLDLTDESFYLLSYRNWDSLPRAASGVQYLYGPVFEMVDYSVPALRVVRLASVLATLGIFGWAFMTWLEAATKRAWPSFLTRTSGVSMIVASGGVVFGWLPLSPGYNDASLLCAVGLCTAVLRSARAAMLGKPLPVLPALVFGIVAVAFLMAKWASAGVTVPFVAAFGTAALVAVGAHGWPRFVVAGAAGAFGALGLVHLALKPLPDMLGPMLEANQTVASTTNSPAALLKMYLETFAELLRPALLLVLLVVVLCAVGTRLQSRTPTLARLIVAMAPVAALLSLFPRQGGLPGGGVGAVTAYSAVLLGMAMLVVACLLWVRRRRSHRGSELTSPVQSHALIWVVVMLSLVPAVQALGTGNPLTYLAVGGFPLWVALFILAMVQIEDSPHAGLLLASVTMTAIVVSATVGVFGTLVDPYRTSGYLGATDEIRGSGPLSGLRVGRTEAERLAAVRAVAAGVPTSRRPMAAYDELPGLILFLDGAPVGEGWFSELDPRRSAVGLEATCRSAQQPLRSPVLFFNRAPTKVDRTGLRRCGWNLDTQFLAVRVPEWPQLTMFLPLSGGQT